MEIPVAAIVLRAVPIVQLVLKIRSKKENKYITAAWFCDVHRSSDCRYRNKNEIKKETGLACFFLYIVKRKIQLLTISVLSIQKGDC